MDFLAAGPAISQCISIDLWPSDGGAANNDLPGRRPNHICFWHLIFTRWTGAASFGIRNAELCHSIPFWNGNKVITNIELLLLFLACAFGHSLSLWSSSLFAKVTDLRRCWGGWRIANRPRYAFSIFERSAEWERCPCRLPRSWGHGIFMWTCKVRCLARLSPGTSIACLAAHLECDWSHVFKINIYIYIIYIMRDKQKWK